LHPTECRLVPKTIEQAREQPERHDDGDADQGTESEVREWIHASSIRHKRPDPLIEAPVCVAASRAEIIHNG
jgi:hypothetical protein